MILITGATGFIGRALVRQLSSIGYPLRALIRPSAKTPRLPKGVPVTDGGTMPSAGHGGMGGAAQGGVGANPHGSAQPPAKSSQGSK